jgi:hypothetical protein
MLEQAENPLFHLERELRATHPDIALEPVVADIGDYQRLEQVCLHFRPRVVLHAAAHKHVPLMEKNPWEAIKNNPAIALIAATIGFAVVAPILFLAGVITLVRDHWKEAWDFIKQAVDDVSGSLKDTWHDFESILGGIHDIMKSIGDDAATAWNSFESAATSVANTVMGALRPLYDLLSGIWGFLQSINPFAGDYQAPGKLGEIGAKALSGWRAGGGPVSAGSSYVVGEQGIPEIFTPGASGFITPLAALGGGGGGDSYHFHIAGSVLTERRLIDVVAEGLRKKNRMSGSQD